MTAAPSTLTAPGTPRRRSRFRRMVGTPSGAIGTGILGLIGLVAVAGPWLAPHALDLPVGTPAQGASAQALLGTDSLGRDVLSRVLHGGQSVLALGLLTTTLAVVLGVAIGMVAGSIRSRLDPAIMRVLDVLLSVPALLLILLLVTGLGTSIPVLVAGVVLVQLPSVARLVRAAAQETATTGYVEAARARGESWPAIMAREILPNIAPLVLADFGIRFGYSVILLASMNYLGLGLEPPSSDWGLMISENRSILQINPWAVLAPTAALALLTVSVNLVTDAYAQTLGRSDAIADSPSSATAATAMPTADMPTAGMPTAGTRSPS